MSSSSTTKERLARELERLETIDLVSAREAVEIGQRSGDITENTDVAIALGELNRIRARINQIKIALASLTHGDDSEVPEGKVGPGRLVRLRFDDEDEETFLFGMVEDRHDEFATLTLNSPIGLAVEGKATGEIVEAEIGRSKVKIEILEVSA